MRLEQIPQSIQTPCNWTAVGAAVGSFVGWIQGPLAAVASILSICWLGLQIFSYFKNRK
jgi:hypothetical protein